MKGSDQDLLSAWARKRTEEAFRALVDRYVGLVYGTALRRTSDSRQAEEVTQDVFEALARKAGRLSGQGGLGGWLFKATVLAAGTARRSEARRERAMREFADLEASLREGGGVGFAGETGELVDEGLAALRAKDREMLVQRYYRGLSFREIASASGRSEVACRQQAKRALAKLSEILGRGGVRVSSAALAAGLTGWLATKAPAAVSASVTASVLSAAPALGGAGILSTLFTIMSTSKVTGIVVVGGLLAVLATGTSYVVGREHAKEALGVAGNGGSTSSAAALPSKVSRIDSGRKELASGESDPIEVIIRELKNYVRGKKWGQLRTVGSPILEPLREEDMERALALIADENEEQRQMLAAMLYGRWAQHNGRAALDAALGESDELVRGFAVQTGIRAWAGEDPEEAFSWHLELVERDDRRINEWLASNCLRILFSKWVRKDVNGAWDRFEKLSSDVQQATLDSLGSVMEEPGARETTASRVARIVNDELRTRAIETVSGDWAEHDPVAAAAWFDSMAIEEPMRRYQGAMEIAEGWFETDVRGAMEWVWKHVPDGMRDEIAVEMAEMAEGRLGDAAAEASWFAERGYDIEQLRRTGR